MKNLYGQFKLLKHLDRLNEWQKGGLSQPIFAAFDLSNICNNRCPRCITTLTYETCDKSVVKREDAFRVISQLKDGGIRAITFAGGGEPTCNPNLEEIMRYTKNKDIEIALWTNGLKLTDRVIDTATDCCTWMRVSLDADGPELYQQTHGMNENCFNEVISNISRLTQTRAKKNKSSDEMTIGATYLLGPHTIDGIYNAAKLARDLGVDYLRFRPFFSWDAKERPFTKSEGEQVFGELKRGKLSDIKFQEI